MTNVKRNLQEKFQLKQHMRIFASLFVKVLCAQCNKYGHIAYCGELPIGTTEYMREVLLGQAMLLRLLEVDCIFFGKALNEVISVTIQPIAIGCWHICWVHCDSYAVS